jgi:hypothetical protein
MYSSITLDKGGNPHISYFDQLNNDLKYARWDSSAWTIQTVDSTGNIGMYTSIALDKDGNPCISYLDYGNGDLKYATSTDQTTPKTNLKVKINDENGDPLSGATITSTTQPNGQTTLSGASGEDSTSFNNVLPGSYMIQASKVGYITSKSSINVVKGTTTETTMTLSVTPATGDLKVTVKDKDGGPLTAASVSSTAQPSGQLTLSGTTGADGVIIFTSVKPGIYTIQASKTGYTSDTAQSDVVIDSSNSINLVLQNQPSTSGGGIPGFPIEAMLLGVILSALLLRTHMRNTRAHNSED